MTAALVASLVLAQAGPPAWRRPPALEVAEPPAVRDARRLLDLARRYLGRPYVRGGVGEPAFDCSGFVCRVYAEAGYALPRVSRDQAKAGRPVKLFRAKAERPARRSRIPGSDPSRRPTRTREAPKPADRRQGGKPKPGASRLGPNTPGDSGCRVVEPRRPDGVHRSSKELLVRRRAKGSGPGGLARCVKPGRGPGGFHPNPKGLRKTAGDRPADAWPPPDAGPPDAGPPEPTPGQAGPVVPATASEATEPPGTPAVAPVPDPAESTVRKTSRGSRPVSASTSVDGPRYVRRTADRVPDFAALAPGDLLFFAHAGQPVSHVGVYVGGGRLIHASSGEGRVTVARLSGRWFSSRLVGARRVLGQARLPRVQVTDLDEHAGRFALPKMLERPAEVPPPSVGPNLLSPRRSALGVRSLVAVEDRDLGGLLVPEVSFHLARIALFVDVALPIRIDDRGASLGRFERFADYLRLVREVRLGLENADVELWMSRFSDLRLGFGLLVDRYVPQRRAAGLVGLSGRTSPLVAFGRLRFDDVAVSAAVDDILEPGLVGVALERSLVGPVSLGMAVMTDQEVSDSSGARAVWAGEAGLSFRLVESVRSLVKLGARGAVLRAVDRTGFGLEALGHLQFRVGSGRAHAVDLRLAGQLATGGFLFGFWGPTHAVAEEAHLRAVERVESRPVLQMEVGIRSHPVVFGLRYAEPFGGDGQPFDRRLEAYFEASLWFGPDAEPAKLTGTFAARAPFSGGERAWTAEAGGRLPLSRFVSFELFAQRGTAWSVGGGLAFRWAP